MRCTCGGIILLRGTDDAVGSQPMRWKYVCGKCRRAWLTDGLSATIVTLTAVKAK